MQTGIGLFLEDSLATTWTMSGTTDGGVTIYKVRARGQLTGRWAGTQTDGKSLGREILSRIE